jgi:TrpR-related protein YerC/YecD
MTISNNDKNKLYEAILALKNEDECKRFLRDLLTEPEINEFTNRWKVARMLDQKVQYEKIAKNTGMSSTTIARISKWLNNGMGGYKLILKRLGTKNHSHAPLVAA